MVLRKSSSEPPLGEPICVSLINANLKGFICAFEMMNRCKKQ